MNATANSQILAKVPLFAGIKDNPAALEALAQLMAVRKFPKGHILIEEGKLGDELFVLIQGQVSIYKKTSDGDVYKVVILKYDMTPAIGEGGLIEAEPRSATVKIDLDSTCLVLTRNAFAQFCAAHADWALPVMKMVSITLMERLRQTSNDLMLLHKALMNEIRG